MGAAIQLGRATPFEKAAAWVILACAFGFAACATESSNAAESSPVATITATDSTAIEGPVPDTGAFTISLSRAVTADTTVKFSVAGTASKTTDYVSLGTSVIIPAGQKTAKLTVTPIYDKIAEDPQTVIVTLSSGKGYTLGAAEQITATVTISDDVSPTITSAPTVTPAIATLGQSMTFTGAGAPDALSYSWDFGDGLTGTGPSVQHTYAVGGFYTVTFTVTDKVGVAVSATVPAVVVAKTLEFAKGSTLKFNFGAKGTDTLKLLTTSTIPAPLYTVFINGRNVGNLSGIRSSKNSTQMVLSHTPTEGQALREALVLPPSSLTTNSTAGTYSVDFVFAHGNDSFAGRWTASYKPGKKSGILK